MHHYAHITISRHLVWELHFDQTDLMPKNIINLEIKGDLETAERDLVMIALKNHAFE